MEVKSEKPETLEEKSSEEKHAADATNVQTKTTSVVEETKYVNAILPHQNFVNREPILLSSLQGCHISYCLKQKTLCLLIQLLSHMLKLETVTKDIVHFFVSLPILRMIISFYCHNLLVP